MSDKPISVGDLVQVVRTAKCGCAENIGVTFTVNEIRTVQVGHPWKCSGCGLNGSASVVYDVAAGHPKGSFALAVLKRIPPFTDLEGEKDASGLDEKSRTTRIPLVSMSSPSTRTPTISTKEK